MIELETLRNIASSMGRSWNISEYFPELNGRVTLFERSDFNETTKIKGGVPKSRPPESLSRSHSGRFTIEVVSNQRCGIDLEIANEIDPEWSFDSESFELAILAPGEKGLIMSSSMSSAKDLATLIWVSKEALAKALGDATNYEPNKIYSPICWEATRPNNWQAVHIDFSTSKSERLIVWLVAERPESPSRAA